MYVNNKMIKYNKIDNEEEEEPLEEENEEQEEINEESEENIEKKEKGQKKILDAFRKCVLNSYASIPDESLGAPNLSLFIKEVNLMNSYHLLEHLNNLFNHHFSCFAKNLSDLFDKNLKKLFLLSFLNRKKEKKSFLNEKRQENEKAVFKKKRRTKDKIDKQLQILLEKQKKKKEKVEREIIEKERKLGIERQARGEEDREENEEEDREENEEEDREENEEEGREENAEEGREENAEEGREENAEEGECILREDGVLLKEKYDVSRHSIDENFINNVIPSMDMKNFSFFNSPFFFSSNSPLYDNEAKQNTKEENIKRDKSKMFLSSFICTSCSSVSQRISPICSSPSSSSDSNRSSSSTVLYLSPLPPSSGVSNAGPHMHINNYDCCKEEITRKRKKEDDERLCADACRLNKEEDTESFFYKEEQENEQPFKRNKMKETRQDEAQDELKKPKSKEEEEELDDMCDEDLYFIPPKPIPRNIMILQNTLNKNSLENVLPTADLCSSFSSDSFDSSFSFSNKLCDKIKENYSPDKYFSSSFSLYEKGKEKKEEYVQKQIKEDRKLLKNDRKIKESNMKENKNVNNLCSFKNDSRKMNLLMQIDSMKKHREIKNLNCKKFIKNEKEEVSKNFKSKQGKEEFEAQSNVTSENLKKSKGEYFQEKLKTEESSFLNSLFSSSSQFNVHAATLNNNENEARNHDKNFNVSTKLCNFYSSCSSLSSALSSMNKNVLLCSPMRPSLNMLDANSVNNKSKNKNTNNNSSTNNNNNNFGHVNNHNNNKINNNTNNNINKINSNKSKNNNSNANQNIISNNKNNTDFDIQSSNNNNNYSHNNSNSNSNINNSSKNDHHNNECEEEEDLCKSPYHHFRLKSIKREKTWEENINLSEYLMFRDKNIGGKKEAFHALATDRQLFENNPPFAPPPPNYKNSSDISKDWMKNKKKLLENVEEQETWNCFSIFGCAPPSLDTAEIFDLYAFNKASEEVRMMNNVLRGYRDSLWKKKYGIPPPKPPSAVCFLSNSVNYSNYVQVWEKYKKFIGCKISNEEWDEHVSKLLKQAYTYEDEKDLDWRNDPLSVQEVEWYKTYMQFVVNKKHIMAKKEVCFCPPPNPKIRWGWNDIRHFQQQKHFSHFSSFMYNLSVCRNSFYSANNSISRINLSLRRQYDSKKDVAEDLNKVSSQKMDVADKVVEL